MTADNFKKTLQQHANPEDAEFLQRFFKTGQGQYGEGDQFIGVRVPQTRKICQQFIQLPLAEVQKLFASPIHEHRLAAVIMLAQRYKSSNTPERDQIFNMYLHNLRDGRVNNWDIVDSSAEFIVGPHEESTDHKLLFDLAKNKNLWQRRVAIMSAFYYLKKGHAEATLRLAKVLLYDSEDLIQKAVGWQLREVGKKVDRQLLLDFLDHYAATMPRTTLRYAIEHLPPERRRYYMNLKSERK